MKLRVIFPRIAQPEPRFKHKPAWVQNSCSSPYTTLSFLIHFCVETEYPHDHPHTETDENQFPKGD